MLLKIFCLIYIISAESLLVHAGQKCTNPKGDNGETFSQLKHLFEQYIAESGCSTQEIIKMLESNTMHSFPEGNLLIGRQDQLRSSDTCGLNKKERYCIISSFNSSEECYYCDANDQALAHNVESIVHHWEPPSEQRANQSETWWQATNGNQNVTLQLDLETEFLVTDIIITFKTFRPAAMYIEKSFDWGQTWKIYRYFAYDCNKEFPGVQTGIPRFLNETVCQSEYSSLAPVTKGEVIYSAIPPNIKENPDFDHYSKETQDLLKTTNVRVTFTKLHTLEEEKLEDVNSINISEQFYYSVYDMTVLGSCFCNGHAVRCVPQTDIPGMVHGTCECEHNTKGDNCRKCMDFYQDLPWKPAMGEEKNECKKCNCNEHSDKCYFDSRVFKATAETSGGVCLGCQHNTEGRNCEMCSLGFYQDPTKQMTDPDICVPCDCEPDGTYDSGLCDQWTDEEAETVAGTCWM